MKDKKTQKVLKGKIVSLKMLKTAVVEVERTVVHPLYKKILTRSKKYKADTGDLTLQVGDVVSITQTKPISRDKHFKIVEVVK